MSSSHRLKLLMVAFCFVLATVMSGFAQQSDQLPANLSNAKPHYLHLGPRIRANASIKSPAITGIDSLVNFTGEYHVAGFDPNGNPQNTWYYDMVGKQPQKGGTTSINAPVVPIVMELLDYDGTIRVVDGHKLRYDATQFLAATMNSPVFQNYNYSSSNIPTQFSDAIQRAEFYNVMKSDWHTVLNGAVKTKRVMRVPRGSYFFALNPNGTCCAFVLVDIGEFVNLLFPAVPTDTTTPIGAAENAGDITTKDMSTFLFPNTYLYFNGDPNQCCVLGFHTYDFEPGDPSNENRERRYVVNYSSWISPGLFGGGFVDVTALSHEIAETYNDPFVASDGVHGITPWWLAPNGNCQDDMESGDVIEGLPRATYPVHINGRTYHPQNEALLQWFEFQSPSTAIGGAYSYPNMETLTALSAPQNAGCQ
ncbi:MAG: hypothetical protein DMG68_12715 [Acidobacteria bacterium]|nr:MAG: hypothetical protein DMG68_12715 [Acidobacteriota bacterium]